MNHNPAGREAVRRLAVVLILPALLGLAGCGGGKGDVTGEVKYNGNPVPAGRVTFLSDAGEHRSFAVPIKDGRYTIPAFPAGPVKISVETFPPVAAVDPSVTPTGVPKSAMAGFGPPAGGDQYASQPGKYVPLPPRFANPEQSGLTYTVTGGKQEHDVEMSGN